MRLLIFALSCILFLPFTPAKASEPTQPPEPCPSPSSVTTPTQANLADLNEVRVQLATNSRQLGRNPQSPREPYEDLLEAYESLMAYPVLYCDYYSRPEEFLSCLQRREKSLKQQITQEIHAPSKNGYFGFVYERSSDSEKRALQALHQFVWSTNANEAVKQIRSNQLNLQSFEDKATFLSMIGRRLLKNYDNSRAIIGAPTSGGSVSNQSLFAGMKTELLAPDAILNTAQGAQKIRITAGVCRDIAAFQAEIARELGLKNVHVSTFAVEGSHHATVSFQDPNSQDPTRVYRLNYSELSHANGTEGAGLLTQQTQEVGTQFRTYGTDGKFKTVTHSSLGKILKSGTGFHASATDDPHETLRNETLIQATRTLNSPAHAKDSVHKAHLTAASTEEQTRVLGLGYQYNRAPESRFDTRVGVSVNAILPDPELIEARKNPSNGGILQVNADQKVATPEWEIHPNLSVQASSTASLEFSLAAFEPSDYSPTVKQSLTPQGDFRASGEVTLRSRSSGHQSQTQLRVISALAQEDVRDAYSFSPHYFLTSLQTQHQWKLSPDWNFFTNLTLTHTKMSERYRIEAGVESQKMRASLTQQGRLQSDDPVLEEGALRRSGLSVSHPFAPGSGLTVSVDTPNEGSDLLTRTRLNAGLKVSF